LPAAEARFVRQQPRGCPRERGALVPIMFGRLAFVLALLALGYALLRKDQTARVNGIVLSTALVFGTLHYVVALPAPAAAGAGLIAFVLTLFVFWQLPQVRGK